MGGPISPNDIVALKTKLTPEVVYEVFNEAIATKYASGAAKVLQKDVIAAIRGAYPAMTDDDIFESGWLDIEEAYREQGWIVRYDQPCYDENYEAFYEFRAK